MEENDTIKRIEEEIKQREKKGQELGMVLGFGFVALWVAALEWKGELVLWKFLLTVVAAAVILAFPFWIGYSLGEEIYNPLNKGKLLGLIIAALALNLYALHFFGII